MRPATHRDHPPFEPKRRACFHGLIDHQGRFLSVLAVLIWPSPLLAHDAFGDLGPFYGSLLHPLADPLQAALLVGTAAFLASRSLSITRWALPVFVAASVCGVLAGVFADKDVFSPLVAASLAALVGLLTVAPVRWVPNAFTVLGVIATGLFVGLAPGPPDTGTIFQPTLGAVLGIAGFATLLWFGLETAARRMTSLVPRVAGSWVMALGILGMAFSV